MKNKRIKHSVCKHCGQEIISFNKGVAVWVHSDPDEDPNSEDYGWVKCLPNEDGSFNYAEPIN